MDAFTGQSGVEAQAVTEQLVGGGCWGGALLAEAAGRGGIWRRRKKNPTWQPSRGRETRRRPKKSNILHL